MNPHEYWQIFGAVVRSPNVDAQAIFVFSVLHLFFELRFQCVRTFVARWAEHVSGECTAKCVQGCGDFESVGVDGLVGLRYSQELLRVLILAADDIS